MSHSASDPETIWQFRHRWSSTLPAIKFLSEVSASEIDGLSLALAERFLRRLPLALIANLSHRELRNLALAFGRPPPARAPRCDAQAPTISALRGLRPWSRRPRDSVAAGCFWTAAVARSGIRICIQITGNQKAPAEHD